MTSSDLLDAIRANQPAMVPVVAVVYGLRARVMIADHAGD